MIYPHDIRRLDLMWPFGKKYGSLAELNAEDDRWSVAHVRAADGDQLLIRVNDTASKWVGHPEMNLKLGFAVPLNNPTPGGLGTPEENKVMQEIEDLIRKTVAERCTGVHVLAITDGSMKEFVFYIVRGPDLKQMHLGIQDQVKTHEVQCIGEIEKKWESYVYFKNMCKGR
jgi:hypothetical protein